MLNNSESEILRTNAIKGKFVYSAVNRNEILEIFEMAIFEDGVVNYDKSYDFENFKLRIQTGFIDLVNTKFINIRGLGRWEICAINLFFNDSNYLLFIESVIRGLNPDFKNMFFESNEKSKRIGNSNYSIFGFKSSILRRDKGDFLKDLNGERELLFFKSPNGYYNLCTLTIYGDSQVLIEGIHEGESELLNLSELNVRIRKGQFITNLTTDAIVKVLNLGSFKISRVINELSIEDKYLGFTDIINKINGLPSTSEVCFRDYQSFLNNPTLENKEILKASYERVPRHNRVYILGDMELKDAPIRNVIY